MFIWHLLLEEKIISVQDLVFHLIKKLTSSMKIIAWPKESPKSATDKSSWEALLDLDKVALEISSQLLVERDPNHLAISNCLESITKLAHSTEVCVRRSGNRLPGII